MIKYGETKAVVMDKYILRRKDHLKAIRTLMKAKMAESLFLNLPMSIICICNSVGLNDIVYSKYSVKALSEYLHICFKREKDHPSIDPGRFCTRMSLRLSEAYKWESVLCDELTASVAVCQYPLDAGNKTILNPNVLYKSLAMISLS